ncbi:hypothetical protein C6P46_001349 [Rhodotorula mucilaginosa]|uniref:Uncharacterized protein n=1 Tax=Rhodotorula mucilaginosa TaxID=5537 RepID=A0A9P6VT33_RHOMI|nr:hypothetical protein C6P46_001349 [Rhodotorula mucilaginosa]
MAGDSKKEEKRRRRRERRQNQRRPSSITPRSNVATVSSRASRSPPPPPTASASAVVAAAASRSSPSQSRSSDSTPTRQRQRQQDVSQDRDRDRDGRAAAACETITLLSSSDEESEGCDGADELELIEPPPAAQRQPPPSSTTSAHSRVAADASTRRLHLPPPLGAPPRWRPLHQTEAESDDDEVVVVVSATAFSRRQAGRSQQHGLKGEKDKDKGKGKRKEREAAAAAALPRRNPRRRQSAMASTSAPSSPSSSDGSGSSDSDGASSSQTSSNDDDDDSDFQLQESDVDDDHGVGSERERTITQETTPETPGQRKLRSSAASAAVLRQRAGAKHKDVPQVLPLQQPGSDEEDAAELSDASTIDIADYSEYDPTSDAEVERSVVYSSSESEQENVPDSEPEACESGEDAPPRRPGRPRKHPPVVRTKRVKSSDKRSQGKQKARKGKEPATVCDPAPPLKKKRGRPRKIRRLEQEARDVTVEEHAGRACETLSQTVVNSSRPTGGERASAPSSTPGYVWAGDPTRNCFVSAHPDEPENRAISRVEAQQAADDSSYAPTSEAEPQPRSELGPVQEADVQSSGHRTGRALRRSPRHDPTTPWPPPVAGPSGTRQFYRHASSPARKAAAAPPRVLESVLLPARASPPPPPMPPVPHSHSHSHSPSRRASQGRAAAAIGLDSTRADPRASDAVTLAQEEEEEDVQPVTGPTKKRKRQKSQPQSQKEQKEATKQKKKKTRQDKKAPGKVDRRKRKRETAHQVGDEEEEEDQLDSD